MGREGAGGGVGEERVVGIESVLLVFDELFAAKVIDGSAEDGFFDGFSGVVSELALGILAKERKGLLYPGYEAIEVSRLFISEW